MRPRLLFLPPHTKLAADALARNGNFGAQRPRQGLQCLTPRPARHLGETGTIHVKTQKSASSLTSNRDLLHIGLKHQPTLDNFGENIVHLV